MSRFQRKGWDDLSTGYRKRLERGGITQQSYDSGVSLSKARGKAGEEQLRQDLATWKDKQRIFYGRKPKEIDASVRGLTKDELRALLKIQAEAETLFDPRVKQSDRPKTKAHKVWNRRQKTVPEWMYYYHGYYA